MVELFSQDKKCLEDLTYEEKQNIIQCVSMNDTNHYKVSWHKKTLCGEKVYKSGDDGKPRYWCYHCDYLVDYIENEEFHK